MARHTDYAPVPNTCPDIDDVISFISDTDAHDKDVVFAILERIRSHNSQLREWGNDLQRQLIGMETDRDYYEKISKQLETENAYYENEITELQNQLS